jgi:hypothetical protein
MEKEATSSDKVFFKYTASNGNIIEVWMTEKQHKELLAFRNLNPFDYIEDEKEDK